MWAVCLLLLHRIPFRGSIASHNQLAKTHSIFAQATAPQSPWQVLSVRGSTFDTHISFRPGWCQLAALMQVLCAILPRSAVAAPHAVRPRAQKLSSVAFDNVDDEDVAMFIDRLITLQAPGPWHCRARCKTRYVGKTLTLPFVFPTFLTYNRRSMRRIRVRIGFCCCCFRHCHERQAAVASASALSLP